LRRNRYSSRTLFATPVHFTASCFSRFCRSACAHTPHSRFAFHPVGRSHKAPQRSQYFSSSVNFSAALPLFAFIPLLKSRSVADPGGSDALAEFLRLSQKSPALVPAFVRIPSAGLVSLTMTCLGYLIVRNCGKRNASQPPSTRQKRHPSIWIRNAVAGNIPPHSLISERVRFAPSRLNFPLMFKDFSKRSIAAESISASRTFRRNSTKFSLRCSFPDYSLRFHPRQILVIRRADRIAPKFYSRYTQLAVENLSRLAQSYNAHAILPS